MEITLRNSQLNAVIKSKGAELCSLCTNGGTEYVWQANPAFWGKHSPVLFPIVGTLTNDTYLFEGKEFNLPRHGFARDMDFDAIQPSENTATFTLEANESTLQHYPFNFELRLKYELLDNTLICTYEVENKDEKTLWFSIGGHPAFNLPLEAALDYTDYYLELNEEEILDRWKLQDGLLSGIKEPVAMLGNKIKLTPSLFYEDALVIKDIKSTKMKVKSDKGKIGFEFSFEGFSAFGIWAAKDAPFVCLEPWCGHADFVDHNQNLPEKNGIEHLEPGAVWRRTWSVKCFQ